MEGLFEMSDREIELFIKDFLKEIREDNAAIFAGAGLSASAGFVNWRELIRASRHASSRSCSSPMSFAALPFSRLRWDSTRSAPRSAACASNSSKSSRRKSKPASQPFAAAHAQLIDMQRTLRVPVRRSWYRFREKREQNRGERGAFCYPCLKWLAHAE